MSTANSLQGRNFLFLQGPTSPFFSRLGDALLQRGAKVYRVNFNMGDWVYWRNKPSWQFRKPVSELPTFLETKIQKHQITDVIMVGDTRPVNAAVLPLVDRYKLRINIFEEGYLRPNFLTLEEQGINGNSRLPRTPDWYRRAAVLLASNKQTSTVKNPVALLGLHEVGYHLPGIVNPVFYPGYKTHRPFISPIELFGWAKRFSQMPFYERRDNKTISDLLESRQPYYLLPLQLDSDSQIQQHSQFTSMAELIEQTMSSFANHAPSNTLLLVKNHPLDTGFTRFSKLLKALEAKFNLQGRTRYLESGHLPTLLDHCEGVIVVNSTVGTSALIHGCKTLALSNPIYDIPGLTVQTELDGFWQQQHTPDKQLLDAFRKVVIHCSQINGGFYSQAGITLAVENACKRLMLEKCPMTQLLEQLPVDQQTPETALEPPIDRHFDQPMQHYRVV